MHALLFALLSLSPAQIDSPTGSTASPPRPWPHEIAGLPPHPDITFGHLENGLRYAWRQSGDPAGEVYLWLHVATGSLAEGASERGMAHFVEHMGFWGGGWFEKGEMIEWAQKNGMAFGPDLNAFTWHDRTAYVLHLQRNDIPHLTEALEVLREFVEGATFDADAVEVEKGVIDAEEREREGPDEATARAMDRFRLDGTTIPERHPIGDANDRRAFSREQLLRFRDHHHGPGNLTVVIVGDLLSDPGPMIATAFADLERVDDVLPPDLGTPALVTETLFHQDRRLASVRITEERVLPAAARPEDAATRQEACPLHVAVRALDRRLSSLTDKNPEAVESASFWRVTPDPSAPLRGVGFHMSAPAESWRRAYEDAVLEVQRALQYGFSDAEIDVARALLMDDLEIVALRDASGLSERKAENLLDAANGGEGDIDPRALIDLLRDPIREVTAETAHAALLSLWNAGRPLFALVGPELPGGPSDAALTAMRDAAWEREVERGEERADSRFAYAADDIPGKIQTRSFDQRQDVHEVVFENGVRLWVRYQEAARMETRVLFGSGRVGLRPDQAALAWTASFLFSSFGLEAHTEVQWRRLLEGNDVGFGFQIREGWLQIGGNSNLRDHLTQCALLASYLDHTAFRDPDLLRFRKNAAQLLESTFSEPEAVLRDRLWEALQRESGFQVYPERGELEGVTLDDLRGWLLPELKATPVDVVAWGGLDVETVIDYVGRTLGKIEVRPTSSDPVRWPAFSLAAGIRIDGTAPAASARAVFEVVYPIEEDLDVVERAQLQLLERIIGDRLRRETRERLALAYAPAAFSASSQVMPGSAYLGLHLACDPKDVEKALATARTAAESLAGDVPLTLDELTRARVPLLADRQDRYQLETLSELRIDPLAIRTDMSERDAIRFASLSDITRFAKRVLVSERASVGVVRPAAASGGGD